MSKDELAQLRADAQDAQQALKSQVLPDGAQIREYWEKASSRSREMLTIARSPIAIGVVGRFSAGKTLLIGTLLGIPDLLPVAGRAATGNVTALRLIADESATDTRIGEPTVEYLTRERLAEAARDMVEELARVARNVPGLDPTGLHGLDPVTDGFGRLEAWLRQLWPPSGPPGGEANPEVRGLVRELIDLRDAVTNGGDLLGHRIKPKAGARLVLDLGDEPPFPDRFPELKRVPLGRETVETDENELRRSFSLIRQVEYDVRVPRLLWDLSSLRDENEVVLLDFPGLGADRSPHRDRYLSYSELSGVNTIVIVVKADDAGAQEASKFYAMMQRHGRSREELSDSILLVDNQFDLIAAPKWIDDRPVDINRLMDASEDIRQFRTAMKKLVGDQVGRVQLVSAVLGVRKYGMSADGFSREAKQKIAGAAAEGERRGPGWPETLARMAAAAPHDPWVGKLRSFVDDGGIAGLRTLIEDHARTHGLPNKVRMLRRYKAELDRNLTRLCRSLRGGSAAEDRQHRDEFRDFLRDVAAGLAETSDAAAIFTQPARLPAALDDIAGESLVGRLRTETVLGVYQWTLWTELLDRTVDFVIPRSSELSQDSDVPGIYTDDPEEVATDTMSTILRQFESHVARMKKKATRQVRKLAVEWVQQRNDELSILRETLGEETFRNTLEDLFEDSHSDYVVVKRKMMALTQATDTSKLAELLGSVIEGVPVDSVRVRERFPMPIDHALPWSALIPSDDDNTSDENARHQVRVMRMRRNIARCAAGVVEEHVAALARAVRRVVERYVVDTRRRLPQDSDIGRASTAGSPSGVDTSEPTGSGPVCELLAKWGKR